MSDDELAPRIPWKIIVPLHIVVFVSASLAVAFSYAEIFPFNHPLGLYRFLPGDILVDFIWVYVFSALIGAILYIILPKLAFLFWKGHRLFTGGEHKYHLQISNQKSVRASQLKRLIIPAFATLGFSSALSSNSLALNFIFVTESFDTLAPSALIIAEIMPIFFILLLISGFIGILFAPAWLLEDAGVIYERDISSGQTTSEISGAGKYYLTLLKGFAGVSTLITYLVLILQMIGWFQILPGQIEVPVLFYALPVVVIVIAPLIAMAPISVTYVLYEKSLRKNVRELQKRMERLGLDSVDVKVSIITD